MPPCSYDHRGASIVTPGQDFNVQTPAAQATGTPNPAIPVDHIAQTPEFLQKLIAELKILENKDSELFAKMYSSPSPMGGRPKKNYQPHYEERRGYQRESEKLQTKIRALKSQIDELDMLLSRPAATTQGTAVVGQPSLGGTRAY